MISNILLVASLALGSSPMAAPMPAEPADAEALVREAWEVIRDHFHDKTLKGVDWDAALDRGLSEAKDASSQSEVHDVINRMLAKLQASHTALLEKETYAVLEAELAGRNTPQVGCQMEERDGGFFVRSLFDRGSAERAGILLGDRVVAVDGDAPEDSPRVRDAGYDPGLPGTPLFAILPDGANPVRITLQRYPNMADYVAVTVTPEPTSAVKVARESVRVDAIDGYRIGRLHIPMFPMTAMDKVVKQALAGPLADCDGLVLDMRGRGGHAGMCDGILSMVKAQKSRFDGRIVALVDERTRSAKEIFAYKFKKAKLGTVVGRRTEGAVLGAMFKRLADGSVLEYGGMDVTFLSGVDLEGKGVEPDVEVDEEIPDYGRGRDPILERGVEVLLKKCRATAKRWVFAPHPFPAVQDLAIAAW